MVLPFGLGADDPHISGRSIIAPSAPLIEADNIHHTSYVDFTIVNENDKKKYTIRADRKSILESSIELTKIINSGASVTTTSGGRRNDNHFIINNVNEIDFEIVIRFLETKFIKFRDHKHVLRILEIADRFNCPDLVIHCVKELDLQLSSMIVLDVFRSLWYYNCISPTKAPVIITQDKRKPKKVPRDPPPFTPEEFLAALLNNSLQLVDMQAELILTKPEIMQLRFEELEMIVRRDTLQMSSEMVLIECLADWSVEECKRKKLDLSDENRRRVLGGLCYTPRYLTLKMQHFREACNRVELLDPIEIRLVRDAFEGKKITNLTSEQNALLERFRTSRPAYTNMPIYLSDRSHPKNYPKKMRRSERVDEDSCWESFGLNCLAIFACIFD